MSKVWFITGTSKGFGRVWAEAALERGDRVVATARNADTLTPLVERYGDDVLALALDVQDKAAIDAAVKQAHERFGRLDVVVNNAGYGLFGTIEEVTEEQARDQIETNLFGALWVTKAALPILREQGSGHIIQVSTIGGVNAFPRHRALPRVQVGARGLQPVAGGRGRRVRDQGHDRRARRASRPTGAARPRSSPSRCPSTSAIRDYRAARASDGDELCDPGDPEATGPAILELVDADEPPLRDVLRHRHARHDPRGVREADRELGAAGTTSPSRRREG